jgi:hypothetical protein
MSCTVLIVDNGCYILLPNWLFILSYSGKPGTTACFTGRVSGGPGNLGDGMMRASHMQQSRKVSKAAMQAKFSTARHYCQVPLQDWLFTSELGTGRGVHITHSVYGDPL